jgi:DNA-binding HxlR family transcriptional regulator
MPNNSSDHSEESDKAVGELKRSTNLAETHPDVKELGEDKNNKEDNIGAYPEPDDPVTEELDQDKIEAFFNKKGAVEILAQLADGPKRFNAINSALVASHGTVANRLTEGAKLGLWGEYITYPDDGGKIKLYELESEAEQLVTLAESTDIAELTERKRQAYTQHKEALSNFRDQLTSDE